MGETALISLTVFLLSYRFLLLLPFITKVFPFMGPQLSLILWMVILFYVIWFGIHGLYNYIFWRPNSAKTLLNMLNANVGTLSYSRLIIVFSIIGLIFTFIYLPHQLVPFFLSIIIAISVNRNYAPQRKWEITDPFSDGLFDDDDTSDSGNGEDDSISVKRNYSWSYSAFQGAKTDFNIELNFNPDDIEQLRRLNPFRNPLTKGYSATVRDMLNQEFGSEINEKHKPFAPPINEVLKKLKDAVSNKKLTRPEQLNYILSFVQGAINYVTDNESETLKKAGIEKEYCRFSRETLYDKEGDCDCKSELAAALFARLGLRVAYLTTNDHAFIGISAKSFPDLKQFLPEAFLEIKNEQFLCCETTATGWTIGKVSDSHRQLIEDSEIIQFT